MTIQRPSNHIPANIVFHCKWWHDHYGFLYDRFGHLGMGVKDATTYPIVEPFGITTIAQVFGCEVIFKEDEEPYAVPLNLCDEEVMKLEPITEFDKIYPINQHVEQANYLTKKYGMARIIISWQGVLSTALKIRGEQLLIDFFENPKIAKKVLEVSYNTTENLRAYIDQIIFSLFLHKCKNKHPGHTGNNCKLLLAKCYGIQVNGPTDQIYELIQNVEYKYLNIQEMSIWFW